MGHLLFPSFSFNLVQEKIQTYNLRSSASLSVTFLPLSKIFGCSLLHIAAFPARAYYRLLDYYNFYIDAGMHDVYFSISFINFSLKSFDDTRLLSIALRLSLLYRPLMYCSLFLPLLFSSFPGTAGWSIPCLVVRHRTE